MGELPQNDINIPVLCQWFLLCENLATKTRWSPALNQEIPICDRCNDKMDKLESRGPSL